MTIADNLMPSVHLVHLVLRYVTGFQVTPPHAGTGTVASRSSAGQRTLR